MVVRIISALVALPLFFIAVYFLPPIGFASAISLLSVIGVYELLWRSKIVTNSALMVPSYILAAVIPYWVHFGCDGRFVFPALFIMTLCTFVMWMTNQAKCNFKMVTGCIFGAVIIPLFLSATIGILESENGDFMILIPFIAAWLTDTGAYFSGMLFGKHKLVPTISPKKTVEGAIGGVIVCIASFLLYGLIMKSFFALELSYFKLAIAGLVLSPIAQVGDLSFSIIKREYNIKDYGVIFPGHGGILDRFDSVIFTAPATLILLGILGF